MCEFKKKNYLKRTDFINSVDNSKVWSKSMTISETKALLEQLEIELSKYQFDVDKNFIMNGRRKYLKELIEENLENTNYTVEELLSLSLFNFFEYIGDEYPGNVLKLCRELGISEKEFYSMDKAYREKGIICAQERDTILEMIEEIKKYVNKSWNKIYKTIKKSKICVLLNSNYKNYNLNN